MKRIRCQVGAELIAIGIATFLLQGTVSCSTPSDDSGNHIRFDITPLTFQGPVSLQVTSYTDHLVRSISFESVMRIIHETHQHGNLAGGDRVWRPNASISFPSFYDFSYSVYYQDAILEYHGLVKIQRRNAHAADGNVATVALVKIRLLMDESDVVELKKAISSEVEAETVKEAHAEHNYPLPLTLDIARVLFTRLGTALLQTNVPKPHAVDSQIHVAVDLPEMDKIVEVRFEDSRGEHAVHSTRLLSILDETFRKGQMAPVVFKSGIYRRLHLRAPGQTVDCRVFEKPTMAMECSWGGVTLRFGIDHSSVDEIREIIESSRMPEREP